MIGRLLRSSKNRTGFWGGSRSDGWWWRHCVMVLKFQLGWHRQWGRDPNGRQSHDITVVAKSAIEDIVVAPTSAVYKKLSFGLVCPQVLHLGPLVHCLHPHPQWRPLPRPRCHHRDCLHPRHDPFLPPRRAHLQLQPGNLWLPQLPKQQPPLLSITETLDCVLTRDDLVTLC